MTLVRIEITKPDAKPTVISLDEKASRHYLDGGVISLTLGEGNGFVASARRISPYGNCPHCGEPGRDRERKPNGNDTCGAGHVYPSAAAVKEPL